RGEEWLSSTPLHVLLWDKLGWKESMPDYAHLPLILKPNGKGKLSKRDGDKMRFPVYAMNWTDPKTGDLTEGFKERVFLPEAFVNMLALLGWNDGTEQEIFSLNELVEKFSIDRIHKGGAKFDYDRALWFNHNYIKERESRDFLPYFKSILDKKNLQADDDTVLTILDLIKERCNLLPELWDNSYYFFRRPEEWDVKGVKKKWDQEKSTFFKALIEEEWDHIAPFEEENI